jgi:hypothetical protein
VDWCRLRRHSGAASSCEQELTAKAAELAALRESNDAELAALRERLQQLTGGVDGARSS